MHIARQVLLHEHTLFVQMFTILLNQNGGRLWHSYVKETLVHESYFLQDPLFGLESELELVDHSFDGREDGGSGHLRAGLGQLADGRFGGDGPMEEGEEGEEEVVGPGEGKRGNKNKLCSMTCGRDS